jgi:glycogen debranching enzyme
LTADSTFLDLPMVGEIERLVRARGSMFLVTTRHGDIAPAGARELGLFHRDTRYLSLYELEIPDHRTVWLSAQTSHPAYNQVDLMLSGLSHEELLDDPNNYLHIRRRQLLDDGLVEEIVFSNFLMRPVDIQAVVRFSADFADIFEVRGAHRPRRGALRRPCVDGSSVVFSYEGLCGTTLQTTVSFGTPPAELDERHARFELNLGPDRTSAIELRVVPMESGSSRTGRTVPFAKRVDTLSAEAQALRARSTRYSCDDSLLQEMLEQTIADLHSLRIEHDRHAILGAGIPWFCAPFGRDALIASYEALTLNPEFAIETLRMLAAYQGKKEDPSTEEEPGKIFHELRFGEMVRCKEIPHWPYYGSIDATALFVIVAEAAHRYVNDDSLLRDLRPAVEAALGWIDARSERGTRLVRYQRASPNGLENQGWKDSRAGVSFPDGRRAEPPIALVEVQGYCADAYERGARILEWLGEPERAGQYRERAALMRDLLNRTFWMEDANRYAFAVDGRDRILPTIVSNSGHLLWSRAATPERARATAHALLAPPSFGGYGIRTLATEQPVYSPLAYHNGTVWPHDNALIVRGFAYYGLRREVAKAFDGLYAAMATFRDRRFPELFCGMGRRSGPVVRYPVACSPQAWSSAAPVLLIQSILGLRADLAPGSRGEKPRVPRLVIRNPGLPGTLRRLELHGMRVGNSSVSVRFRRVGSRCHVDRLDVTGAPLRIDIKIE